VWEEVWRLLSFVALVCVWFISIVVVEGASLRDCMGTRGVYSWYSRLVRRW
jgi:hypothetical protein